MTHMFRFIFIQIALWLALPIMAWGQHAQTKAMVAAWQARTGFQGVVLVGDAEGIQSLTAYGLADRSWNLPMTTEAVFPIASVTKTFTAQLVSQAVVEGRMQWSDTLGKWLPLAGNPIGGLSLHQLVQHTSGLPHWEGIPEYWRRVSKQSYTPAEAFGLMQQVALTSVPGETYHYSSLGYWWLGRALEAEYQQPFEAILAEKLLIPLQMHHTGTMQPQAIVPKRVQGYHQLRPDSVVQAPYRDYGLMLGGGNMYSTAEDLYRWCLAQEQSPTGWKEQNDAADGGRWYYHGGGTWGASSLVSVQPATGQVVILLSNLSGIPIETQWRALLYDMVHGASAPLPASAQAVRPLEEYTGTYASESGVQMRIWLHQEALMARLGHNPAFALEPIQPEQFYGQAIEGTFAFGGGAGEEITTLRVTRFGQSFDFHKLP